MEAIGTSSFGLMALLGLPIALGGLFSGSWIPAGILALGLNAAPAPLPPAIMLPMAHLLRAL